MTIQFKFAEPHSRQVVEIDPKQGEISTSRTGATIGYRINTDRIPDVTLNIDDQALEAEDVDELISFLETIRTRL